MDLPGSSESRDLINYDEHTTKIVMEMVQSVLNETQDDEEACGFDHSPKWDFVRNFEYDALYSPYQQSTTWSVNDLSLGQPSTAESFPALSSKSTNPNQNPQLRHTTQHSNSWNCPADSSSEQMKIDVIESRYSRGHSRRHINFDSPWKTQNGTNHFQRKWCNFCKNNKETFESYTSHNLHENGATSCPVLLACVCSNCGQGGHTLSHCPQNPTGYSYVKTLHRYNNYQEL